MVKSFSIGVAIVVSSLLILALDLSLELGVAFGVPYVAACSALGPVPHAEGRIRDRT